MAAPDEDKDFEIRTSTKRFRPTLPRTDLPTGPDGLAQEDERIVHALRAGIDVEVLIPDRLDWRPGDRIEIVDKDYRVVGRALVKADLGGGRWKLGDLVSAT